MKKKKKRMKLDKRKYNGTTKRLKYWQMKHIIRDTTLASQCKCLPPIKVNSKNLNW